MATSKQSYTDVLSNDPELKTPEHDNLMIYVQNHHELMVNEYVRWLYDATIQELAGKGATDDVLSTIPNVDAIQIDVKRVKWEFPVVNETIGKSYQSKRVIGFVDMLIEWETETGWEWQYEVEKPRFNAVGTTKEEWTYHLDDKLSGFLCLEIKPKILSIGDTVRQVSMYREFIRDSVGKYTVNPIYFSVVTNNMPDNRAAFEVFVSQRIGLFICTDGGYMFHYKGKPTIRRFEHGESG